MSNFKIGGEVVCVKSHTQGDYKEGDIFPVKGLKIQSCCGDLVIDIGIVTSFEICRCKCGLRYKNDHYYRASSFFPLDDLDISEVIEVLNEEPFKS